MIIYKSHSQHYFLFLKLFSPRETFVRDLASLDAETLRFARVGGRTLLACVSLTFMLRDDGGVIHLQGHSVSRNIAARHERL